MTPIAPDQDNKGPESSPTAQDEHVSPPGDTQNGHHETIEVQGERVDVETEDVLAPPRPPATEVQIPDPTPPPAPSSPPAPHIETPDPPAPPEDPSRPDDAAAAAPDDEDRRRKIAEEIAAMIAGDTAAAQVDAWERFADALRNGQGFGAAAEIVLPDEVVEINREVECEIYGIRYGRLAGSPTSRAYLTITFDAVRHSRLSGLLGANLKGRMNITFNNLQAPLEEDDEKDLPPAGVAVIRAITGMVQGELPTRRTPEDVIAERLERHRQAYATDPAGTVFKPHSFAPSAEDAAKCALCNAGESHALHEGQKRQTAARALRRRRELLIPHPFEAGKTPEGDGPVLCVYCDLEEADELHARGEIEEDTTGGGGQDAPPTYSDRVTYWRDVEGLEESIAQARAAEDVAEGRAVQDPTDDSTGNAAADALIDEARADVGDELQRPPAEDELTDEQRDARRRLRDRSGDMG